MRQGNMLEVLTWVYRDELVKRHDLGVKAGWSAGLAEQGITATSGSWNMRPVTALGAPHPDALLINDIVFKLRPWSGEADVSARELALHLLGPMAAGISEKALSRAVAREVDIAYWLRMLALRVLPWPVRETWSMEPIRDDRGHIKLFDAEQKTARIRIGGKTGFTKVYTGSPHCCFEMVPSPAAVLEERLRWSVLAQAMEALVDQVKGCLESWDIRGTGVPIEPWRGDVIRMGTGKAAKGSVLEDASCGMHAKGMFSPRAL